MENIESDRLWDQHVQEFIAACKHERLSDISIGYSFADDELLNVSAMYKTRRGRLLPIGYRWVESKELGKNAEVYLGTATSAGGHEEKDFFRIARKARLWFEQKHVAHALLAVTTLHFKGLAVRNLMQISQLKALTADAEFTAALLKGKMDDDLDIPERKEEIAKTRELTLQTLNDLAHLYGARSGEAAA